MSDNPYRDRLLSVGVLQGGLSKSQVKDRRAKDGHRIKETIDENGGSTLEHANSDRVDVNIRPKVVDVDLAMMGK